MLQPFLRFVTAGWLGLVSFTAGVPASASGEATAGEVCQGLRATVVSASGDVFVEGTSDNDVIVAGEDVERIEAHGGDDVVCGGPASSEIEGGRGRDLIYGGAGDDRISGDGSIPQMNDQLFGGPGRDFVLYNFSLDGRAEPVGVNVDLASGVATGAGFRDRLTSFEGIEGSPYNDVLLGDRNDNIISGGGDFEDLDGCGCFWSGIDVVLGRGGEDRLDGGASRDFVDGGPGADTLFVGGLWHDVLAGSGGTDVLVLVDCVIACSWFDYETESGHRPAPQAYNVSLDLGSVFALDQEGQPKPGVEGILNGMEAVTGSDGPDVLTGTTGRDTLLGGAGDDQLDGLDDVDRLDGGDGDDRCLNGESVIDCEGDAPSRRFEGFESRGTTAHARKS